MKNSELINAYAETILERLTCNLIADEISMPKMKELVEEYDNLSNRHWKRKRQLEHIIFWVAYKKYKNKSNE